MKKIRVLVMAALISCFALPALAGNTVKVTGDVKKDGRLLIDVNWDIDTAKYPGMTRDQIREKVMADIREKTLPKLVDATQGHPVSFDKCNFHVINEQSNLREIRPDGTKRYTLDLKIQFNATSDAALMPTITTKDYSQKYETALNQRWDDDL
jgi:hypothetical protein